MQWFMDCFVRNYYGDWLDFSVSRQIRMIVVRSMTEPWMNIWHWTPTDHVPSYSFTALRAWHRSPLQSKKVVVLNSSKSVQPDATDTNSTSIYDFTVTSSKTLLWCREMWGRRGSLGKMEERVDDKAKRAEAIPHTYTLTHMPTVRKQIAFVTNFIQEK